MKITQTISNQPTRITLTAARDFILKLKGADVYIPSAFVGDTLTVEEAREIFDEVGILDVPKFNGALKQQQAVLAAAGVSTAAVPDETAGDETPLWAAGEMVKAGQVRRFGNAWYRCAQAHVTQAGWEPPGVPALWVRIEMPAADGEPPPAWVQPAGAHDAYAAGARVTHAGKVWESAVDANVYAPGVVSGQWVEV
ncbi:MAG: hypothetical protein LBC18_04250 [Opitutaceae bacterium]|jgi:hypothetical protein|nr:hypothetical protein [Opitutaceae bacterium]